jgi:hypothetical protein
MRFFQLTSQLRLAVGDPWECEEAIFKVTRQDGAISQVFERLSLGVQQPLNALDDFIAMGQEELEEFDMCLKRHRRAIVRGFCERATRREFGPEHAPGS